MGIVATPLGDFNPVQWSVGVCGNIYYCNATARLAQSTAKKPSASLPGGAVRWRMYCRFAYIHLIPRPLTAVGAERGCESD